MPTCRQCKHFEEVDLETGMCFGHQVSGDQDSKECPTHSFVPVEKPEGGER